MLSNGGWIKPLIGIAGLGMALCALAFAGELPPLSAEDIPAMLQRPPADTAAFEQYQAEANELPPAAARQEALAVFYHRRGLANGRLGRAQQQIADLWQAHELGRQTRSQTVLGDIDQIRTDLALAELLGGSILKSIELGSLMVSANASDNPHDVYWCYVGRAILAIARAKLFDLNGARGAIKELDGAYWDMKNNVYIQHGGAGTPAAIADILFENSHALLLDLEGDYGAAEARHRRAVELAQGLVDLANSSLGQRFGDPAMRAKGTFYLAIMDDFLANNLRYQGRNVEAESQARAALRRTLDGYGRYSHYTALNLYSLGRIFYESGRLADAVALARESIISFERAGASAQSANLGEARLLLGDALLAQGRWAESAAVFAERDRALALDARQYALWSGENVGWGYALLRAGNPVAALPMMERVYRRHLDAGHAANEAVTAQTRGFLAMALAANGQAERALAEFRGAVPVLIENAGRDSGGSLAHQMYLAAILEAYMGLLVDLKDSPLLQGAGIDATAEAFRVADIARGSAVQRAMAESAARATPADPALADLARRSQDAERHIGALAEVLNHLLAAPPAQQVAKTIADIRRDIAALRDERAELKHELDRRFPEYADLVAPKPVSLAQAQSALAPGEALVAIYVGADRSYVWAVPKTGKPVFASVGLGQAEVARRVARLRAALDVGGAELESVPAFDVAAAHDLYRLLLEPVAAGWREAKTLVVVPHQALGQLPFALLSTAPAVLKSVDQPLFAGYRRIPWLIRQTAVTQLPAVGTLATLRRLPVARPGRREFIGFGDPLFSQAMASATDAQSRVPAVSATRGLGRVRNLAIDRVAGADATSRNSAGLGQLSRLEDTAAEIRGVAAAVGADPVGDVFLGKDASETNVRSGRLANRRIVMFATHGLLPGDLNGLTQPALALSAPEVTGNAGENGLLTTDKVLGLKLDADWVVLSACNTAAGAGAGAEALSGLGRAFFFAGARTLLVSNWPVETVSARLLTTRLFEHQVAHPAASRAEALQATMLDLIDHASADGFTYAHPLFWAPFSLVGDGR